MIRLLLALYPRRWRRRFEDEFRALLESTPLTLGVVLDVVRNAARQHAEAHPKVLDAAAACLVSVVVQIAVVRSGISRNILWPPTSPLRAFGLGALLVLWLPLAADLVNVARRRRAVASSS